VRRIVLWIELGETTAPGCWIRPIWQYLQLGTRNGEVRAEDSQEMSHEAMGDRAMKLREFYATHYGKDENPDAHRVHLIVKALSALGPVQRVLDVGCGDGTLGAVFARYSNLVAGIEISMEACTIAHSRGVEVAQADVENYAFPFRPESFDVVVAGEIIEHMTDPDHFLREIARVLKPNGHCILTTPNLASWYNRLLLLLGYQPYHTDVSFLHQVGKLKPIVDGGSGHFRVFTLRALRELLTIHHLRPIAIEGCTVPMTLRFPLNMVERTLSSFPAISSYLVVLTRKEDGGGRVPEKEG